MLTNATNGQTMGVLRLGNIEVPNDGSSLVLGWAWSFSNADGYQFPFLEAGLNNSFVFCGNYRYADLFTGSLTLGGSLRTQCLKVPQGYRLRVLAFAVDVMAVPAPTTAYQYFSMCSGAQGGTYAAGSQGLGQKVYALLNDNSAAPNYNFTSVGREQTTKNNFDVSNQGVFDEGEIPFGYFMKSASPATTAGNGFVKILVRLEKK